MSLHVLQCDPGTEYLIPWARKKLNSWHAESERSGQTLVRKTVQVSDGSVVYAWSQNLGNGAWLDKIRITGGAASILVRSDDTKFAVLSLDCKKIIEYTDSAPHALMACLGTTVVSSATSFGGPTYYLNNALTGALIATIPATDYGAYPASGGGYFAVGEKDASHFSIHPRDAASGIATHLTDKNLSITSTGAASVLAGNGGFFGTYIGSTNTAGVNSYYLRNVITDADLVGVFTTSGVAQVVDGYSKLALNQTYVFMASGNFEATGLFINVFSRETGAYRTQLSIANPRGQKAFMCLTCDEDNLLVFVGDLATSPTSYLVRRYKIPALPALPDVPVFTFADVSANFTASVGNGNSVRNQVLIPVINRQF